MAKHFNLIRGDLFDFIPVADVLLHGCNCFCTMGAGIAVEFARRFEANTFFLEQWKWRGNTNKLGNIDFAAQDKLTGLMMGVHPSDAKRIAQGLAKEQPDDVLFVVNGYTQYKPGPDAKYWALESVIWKTCNTFPGMEIYLPMIGSGLGGLEEEKTLEIFSKYPINVVQYVNEG